VLFDSNEKSTTEIEDVVQVEKDRVDTVTSKSPGLLELFLQEL